MNLLDSLAALHDFAMPIVDAHHHLWDLKAGHYPTKQDQYDKNFFLGDYRKICRDYMPGDYVDALKGPDRIIFASNLPVASLSTPFGGIVAVMREALAKEPPDVLARFSAGNAICFYRIPIQVP